MVKFLTALADNAVIEGIWKPGIQEEFLFEFMVSWVPD
jgi:hypothetical protein